MRGWIGIGLVLASVLLWGFGRAAESDSLPDSGVRLVHDFFPGEFEEDRSLLQLTKLGDVLFFVTNDLERASAVWRTDGTVAGTRRARIARYSGELAWGSILGQAGPFVLWVTSTAEAPDVTLLVSSSAEEEGIVLRDILPIYANFTPTAVLRGRLYFFGCEAAGCSLWSTDGTRAGTWPVRPEATRFTEADLPEMAGTFADRWVLYRRGHAAFAYDIAADRVLPLLSHSNPYIETFSTGNTLFLRTSEARAGRQWVKLWVSRLDTPQAKQFWADWSIGIAGWRDGLLYFAPEKGRLFSTDGRNTRPYFGPRLESFSFLADQLGTIGSTTLIPVPGYYWPSLLAADETRHESRELLHFECPGDTCVGPSVSAVTVAGNQAYVGVGDQLWQSDGTPQGTKPHEILAQVNVGSFRALDGRLLLGATSRQGEEQLWETDGTARGTRPLSNGTLERPFRVQEPPVPLGGAFLVNAVQNPVGQQLWRVANGQATPLTELRHLASGIEPTEALPLGDRVVLTGSKSVGWFGVVEDGPAEPLPLRVLICSYEPCSIVIGQRLFFPSYDFPYDPEVRLGFTDGTVAGSGTLPLRAADGTSSPVALLGRLGDRALVLTDSGDLWLSDGSASGTRIVTRLPTNPRRFFETWVVERPVSLGPLVFLFRRAPVPGHPRLALLEIWRTDGTAAGTLRLATTPFLESYSASLSPAVVDGRLFFQFGGTLWTSDGTIAGTHPLRHQLPGGTFGLAAGRDVLYAAAGNQDDDGHQTLWAIDPATFTASLLGTFRDVGGGNVGTTIGSVLGNDLIFLAKDERCIDRWWVTDGTQAGTHRVRGLLDRNPAFAFTGAGDRFYATVCDNEHGCELWSTDRHGNDTRIEIDLWPGPRSSDAYVLAVSETALWFAATEPSAGREIWKLGVSERFQTP